MITRLLGGQTSLPGLHQELDASSRSVRAIAHRVANAGNPDFQAALEEAGERPVDLEKEMVALADEQLRYETTANLLQKVYQQVRSSVRER